MRTVVYRDVVRNIGDLLGINPRRDLAPAHAEAIARRTNSWLRKGTNYRDWKALEFTEERTWREIWRDDQEYAADREIYFPGDEDTAAGAGYYTITEATAAGESPLTAPAKFQTLVISDFYLPAAQIGDPTIGDLLAVYPADPRLGRVREFRFALSGRGYELRSGTSDSVWITYRRMGGEFTSEPYNPSRIYSQDDLVYDPETGECYRAARAEEGIAISDAGMWYLQEFPWLLQEYVQYGVASDLAEDVPTKQQYAAEAEERIIQEKDNEKQQGVGSYYALGERRPYYVSLTMPATVLVEAS